MSRSFTRILSFNLRLFLSVTGMFVIFTLCFMAFQYEREKTYKRNMLNIRLQQYNDEIYGLVGDTDSLQVAPIEQYLKQASPYLRLTLIDATGKVLYDNSTKDLRKVENHLLRREVQEALRSSTGYESSRQSRVVNGQGFFYAAHYYPQKHLIVRTSLPYDMRLSEYLRADSGYLWFTLVVFLILVTLFYRFTRRLGLSIVRLQQFAMKADRNEPIEPEMIHAFPHNELGEISQHIIKIYKRLHRAKEALYIEREKLIAHLQTSHEGLGVFTKERKEILVNKLFTQYADIISDKNLGSMEDVFTIPELSPVDEFLHRNGSSYDKEEKRISFHIHKNARSFSVECILFQDLSFEISINDTTQEEEQARLKRQLTQNIAHELKTPVSSIQGYLETIISNPNISHENLMTFLERSYAQSNRLAFLLRDISVLTRMDEAPDMVEREKLDVSKIVENILNEVALGLEEKQIRVVNLLPPRLSIVGNYSLIYSIFRNLTDNAIAYAGSKVQITINCFRQDEKFYYFSFADTGIGVPEEHLNRLFERFYRIDKGRSRKLGGTGLGLAIVKNAVLFHGGTIFAKNAPGGGLEFVFTLKK